MTISRQDPYSIVIDYYEGSRGPTIVLDVQEREPLLKLKTLLLDLAEGRAETVDLIGRDFVEASGIDELRLGRVPEGKESFGRTLRRVPNKAGRVVFGWERDPEGWLESAEMLDPLIEAEQPCHQYLADGDALLEVDYLEHR